MNKMSLIFFFGVFIASISQVFLKKSSQKKYGTRFKEYFNWLVISGYAILFVSLLINIYAYRFIDLKFGPIIESSGYIYVIVFSRYFFNEKISLKKLIGVLLIIIGIIVFSL